MIVHSRLPMMDLQGRRVIVRFDGNVPLSGTMIANDYRLQALLPTLRFIQQKGGSMTLITHLGRPKQPEPALSTKLLQPWFEEHGFTVTFAEMLDDAYQLSIGRNYNIVLLENIRFFKGEKAHDVAFAQELARLGDVYVNDAFATLHRTDTSVTLLAEQFCPDSRTIGLLVEKELTALATLLNPQHPFVVILGGGKPETKVPVIAALLGIADTIVILPALTFTFNKAHGKPVGKSLVDDTLLATARTIMAQAQTTKTKLVFPADYRIFSSKNGPLTTVTENQFPQDGIGVSIGPKTLEQVLACMQTAKTVFFNGSMGFSDRPETLAESCAILEALAYSPAYSVIAGGNSLDLVFKLHTENKYNYLSTGGGATLMYIAGEPLPGLEIFMRDQLFCG